MTWVVEAWTPGLTPPESLVGETGTVVTYDSKPRWPVFQVHGTEDGVTVGATIGCLEHGHAHGRWTVEAVKYKEYKYLGPVPIGLILKEAVNE